MLQIFQSTLPRVERQLSILAYSFPCQISIHAPASGATVTSVNIKLSFNISIHAPASGATVNILKQNPNKVYFNPRSREWSDQESTDRVKCRTYFNPRSREWSDTFDRLVDGLPDNISIHAPASGATARSSELWSAESISIHAPASGATAFIDIFSFTVRLYFISSH